MKDKNIEKNAAEIHWYIEQTPAAPAHVASIFEFRGKWYWCDEKGQESAALDSMEKAKEEQRKYFNSVQKAS